MNQKIENWVLGGIAAVFCLYILVRAWLLPITVDESATAINHVPRLVFDTLTFQKEANPNNHILNTLLIKILTGIFGWHHFVVRMPVLIGGLLYAWASLNLVRKISDHSWVRVFSLAMLFGNPYLLEFFSLARGYGLAAGLLTVALFQAWRFMETNDARVLRRAILFAGLAVYANFTLLIFFAPFVFALGIVCWQLNPGRAGFVKTAMPAMKALGVFLLLWYVPLSRLSKDSEIVNWNALGTFFDSVQRSVRAAIHANAYLGSQSDSILTPLLMLGAVVIIGIALWRFFQRKFQFSRDPRVFLVLMLLGAIITNVAQVYATHTPYLQSRLALFYWPLFALSLGCAASWIMEQYGRKKVWIFMAPLLVLFFINTVRTADLHTTFEWFHDTDTFTVLDYIEKVHKEENRTEPFTFDTEWFMQNSFLFHLEKGFRGYDKYVKMVPYHGRRLPQRDADFFYGINYAEAETVLDAYNIVLRIPNSSLILLRKK